MEWGCAPLQLQTRGTSAMLEAARQFPASVSLAFGWHHGRLISEKCRIEASCIIAGPTRSKL